MGREGRAAVCGVQRPRRAKGLPGCPGRAQTPAPVSKVNGERPAVVRDRGKVASEEEWGTHCQRGSIKGL